MADTLISGASANVEVNYPNEVQVSGAIAIAEVTAFGSGLRSKYVYTVNTITTINTGISAGIFQPGALLYNTNNLLLGSYNGSIIQYVPPNEAGTTNQYVYGYRASDATWLKSQPDHTKILNIGNLTHPQIDTLFGVTIPATYVPKTLTLTEGAGLAGNTYDLSANRTLAMGTPSSITSVSTNSASGTTHTHLLGVTYTGPVLMGDGITPADPMLTEDQTDWLYKD